MKYLSSVLILCHLFLTSEVFAKGSVDIGMDSISIRYNAVPLGNPSNYSVRQTSIYRYSVGNSFNTTTNTLANPNAFSTAPNLISRVTNRTLSLTELTTLSNVPFSMISTYSAQATLNAANFSSAPTLYQPLAITNDAGSVGINYVEPPDDDDGLLVDASIEIWGKDQISGIQLGCSIFVSQSIINYISVKVSVDLFGAGRFLVTYVDPINGQCTSAYIL